MPILLTGAAGFIGYHCALQLLRRGERVIGVDNLNEYYDPALKEARLAQLHPFKNFSFERLELSETESVNTLFRRYSHIDRILHLAAQAGVRYSLDHPHAYIRSNVTAQINLLEAAAKLGKIDRMVYASSSSVYGGNRDLPFSVEDRVDHPLSLYGATKRMDELLGEVYAHLYGLCLSGLRFFTVYGPWGRPDMSAYIFTKAILNGTPIPLFNSGEMRRDFTYIDDIVAGVLAALDRPESGSPHRHRIYNLGNSHPEDLRRFIAILEEACGKKANLENLPMQAGDVPATFADISRSQEELGFNPRIRIEEGLPRFVSWFRAYHQL